jgi:hypothetical protein
MDTILLLRSITRPRSSYVIRVVEDSSVGGVLKEASLTSEAIVRSSAGFGSLDGPFVVG